MDALWNDRMLEALVTVLAHFLWQGCVLAAAVAVVIHIIRPQRPQVRYLAYCVSFVLMAICPLFTFCVSVSTTLPSVAEVPAFRADIEQVVPIVAEGNDGHVAHGETTMFQAWQASTSRWIAQHRTAIAVTWLSGVALFAVRLAVAAVWLRRMRRNYLPLSPDLMRRASRLAEKMGFQILPDVRVVAGLTQGLAAGVLRPMVLVPAAWLAELDPATLEAVLAHELAHLKRWDLAVNAVQRVVETLLFFHPAVWWCSLQIRREREMCCDELAAAALDNRADYARALVNLAEQVAISAAPAWSAGSGGSRGVLLARVRQLLGATTARGPCYGPSCALSGALIASLVWGGALFGISFERSPIQPPSAKLASIDGQHEFGIPLDTEKKLFRRVLPSPNTVPPPHEHRKVSLPPYTIEPPDILMIELLALSPGENYRIHPGDRFAAQVNTRGESGEPVHWVVNKHGFLDFDEPKIANVKSGGLTVAEAVTLIRARIMASVPKDSVPNDVEIQIWLERAAGLAPIKGEFLVSPDGSVNLGAGYGVVHLAGMRLEEAKAAIEEQLAKTLDKPEVAVDVFAYNSKVYYVIMENSDKGDQVARLPVTGNDTVLDALAQTNGLDHLEKKKIWIARPTPGKSQADTILPVNFQEIAHGGATGTNYQILPGDRIFVAEPKLPTTPIEHGSREWYLWRAFADQIARHPEPLGVKDKTTSREEN